MSGGQLTAEEYTRSNGSGRSTQSFDGCAAASRLDPEPFRIETNSASDGTIVTSIGELDPAIAGPLQDLLIELEPGKPDRVVCDLRRLSFADCSGLRVPLDAAARARLSDRQLTVLCAARQVSRLFLSDADRQLDIAKQGAPRQSSSQKTTS